MADRKVGQPSKDVKVASEKGTTMKRRTNIVAATALVGLAAGVGSMAATAGSANASSPTLQTVTKVETLVSPKCYHIAQTTRTYYHWSLTHYVLYSGGPRVTTLSQTVCHK